MQAMFATDLILFGQAHCTAQQALLFVDALAVTVTRLLRKLQLLVYVPAQGPAHTEGFKHRKDIFQTVSYTMG